MKHIKTFEGRDYNPPKSVAPEINPHSTPSHLLKKITVDLAVEDNPMQLLQEIIEQFDLQIINLWPIGPAGANPQVTFRGKGEDIMDMVKWLLQDSGQDAYEFYDEYSENDSPIPFEVQSDPRYNTMRHREFINVDGTAKD